MIPLTVGFRIVAVLDPHGRNITRQPRLSNMVRGGAGDVASIIVFIVLASWTLRLHATTLPAHPPKPAAVVDSRPTPTHMAVGPGAGITGESITRVTLTAFSPTPLPLPAARVLPGGVFIRLLILYIYLAPSVLVGAVGWSLLRRLASVELVAQECARNLRAFGPMMMARWKAWLELVTAARKHLRRKSGRPSRPKEDVIAVPPGLRNPLVRWWLQWGRRFGKGRPPEPPSGSKPASDERR